MPKYGRKIKADKYKAKAIDAPSNATGVSAAGSLNKANVANYLAGLSVDRLGGLAIACREAQSRTGVKHKGHDPLKGSGDEATGSLGGIIAFVNGTEADSDDARKKLFGCVWATVVAKYVDAGKDVPKVPGETDAEKEAAAKKG